jgi:hypothetical protein
MTFTEKNRRAGKCRIIHTVRIKNVHVLFLLYQVLCYSRSILPQCILFRYLLLEYITKKVGVVNFYLGGTVFESQPEHCLPRLRFFVVSSVSPGKCQCSASIRPELLPSKSYPFYSHPTI